MPQQPSKPNKSGTAAPKVRSSDDCQTNTGNGAKESAKPECPDGYPNEQPSRKPDKPR